MDDRAKNDEIEGWGTVEGYESADKEILYWLATREKSDVSPRRDGQTSVGDLLSVQPTPKQGKEDFQSPFIE